MVPRFRCMRSASWVLLVAVACGSSRQNAVPPAVDAGSGSGGLADAGGTADSGTPSDSGVPTDAGSADASVPADGGPASDAGVPGDAGVPATIGSTPCPANPPVLWSRTFKDEVDFRGAADPAGNLYWGEYDPPATFQTPAAPAWLVSADADGKDRYRVATSLRSSVHTFIVAGAKVVVSSWAVISAYDAATGAAAWSLDLSATYRDGYATVQGIADLGNGELALAMYDYGIASGLYLVDGAKGAILWSAVGAADTAYVVQGSDGAGHALVQANPTSSYSADQGYHTSQDLFAVDSSGHELWRHRIADSGA